jgi:RNA polymerase sigma-70 factor (ECF subfamily)
MLSRMAGEPDDTALMLRYRAGDTLAFEMLYARHKGPLFRFLLRQCNDRDLAGDLFQEAWARIIKARLNYEPGALFTTYMYQIARNLLIDEWRRRGRRPADQAGDGEDPDAQSTQRSAADGAIGLEAAEAIRRSLAALPDDQREAFLLREEGGLSLAEIASVTGVAEETAKSRLRYAVSKLRRSLLEQGAWP